MFKRVLSMVLVLVTLVSVLPPRVEAEDVQPRVENSVTMEGTNSFGNLLANTMNESPEAQTEGQDNRVCDLVIEGTTATVEYTTTKNAKVVVAVYTEDGTKMLGSGTAEVTPEETAVVVEIQISPMPTYYSAGAYLLDAKTNDPLSPVFRTQLYTKAVQDIKNSTVEDYDPEKVLNLDEDNTTNFAVFGENTLLLSSMDTYGMDSENALSTVDGRYIFENASEEVRGLKPGDSFAFPQEDGEFVIAKVAGIDISGSTVIVTEDPNADLSDVFDVIKIEGASHSESARIDTSTMDEALEPMSESEALYDDGETADFDADFGGGSSIEFGVKVAYNPNENASVEGKVTVKMKLELRAYITSGYQYFSWKRDTNLSGSVIVKGKNKLDLSMGKVTVPIVFGVRAELEPKLLLEFSGSVKYNIAIKSSEGRAYDSELGDWQDIGSGESLKQKVDFNGKIFVGMQYDMSIILISKKIGEVKAIAKIGVEISLSDNWISSSTSSPAEIHLCTTCFEGEANAVGALSLKYSFFNGKLSLEFTLLECKTKICDLYFSPDYAENGPTRCPHRIYRLTAQVYTDGWVPMQGQLLQLYSGGKEVNSVYYGRVEQDVLRPTDSYGKLCFYLPSGKYELRKDGNVLQQFTIGVTEKKLTIQMAGEGDTRKLTLSEANVSLDPIRTETRKIKALYYASDSMSPMDVSKAAKWESSAPTIVSVSDGLLKAWSKGTAVITAKYTVGDTQFTAQCTVTAEKRVDPDQCGDNLKWSVDGTGTLTISGTGAMWDYYYYQFPEGLSTAPWSGQKLKKLVIREGVTAIGASAFAGCDSLTAVQLPDSLEKIGATAFMDCDGLKKVKLPKNLEYLGIAAFSGCSSLSGDLTIPSRITCLQEDTFDGCTNLNGRLTLPDGLQDIEPDVFRGCSFSGDLVLPANAEISIHAFSGVVFTGTLKLPSGITSIATEAFYHASFQGDLVIPENISEIGEYAFSSCQFGGKLTLPRRMSSIGAGAFEYNDFTGTLVLPQGLQTIESDAFQGNSFTGDLIIPDTVTSVADNAFKDNSFDGILTLPDGLKTIGELSFSGCPFTGDLIIPNAVTKIGSLAFVGGRYDGSLMLSNKMTEISPETFHSNSNLKKVYIPKGIKEIGEEAFRFCIGLKDVYYSGTGAEWSCILIASGNEDLLNATIHFSDGTTSQTFSLDTPEVPDPTETMEETEPTEETIPETTEEITPETTEESIEETTEETTAYPEGTYIAPEGGDLVETPVLEEMSMYTGKETVKNSLRTVAFVGLEPGEEYVLIVSLRPGSVAPADLQYIEQAAASAEGKVRFTYIPRTDVSAIPQLYGISAQREIKLDREYLTMALDALSEPLTATVTPEEWADEVTWSSEDENILTVDSKGYVTPVAVGTGYAVATVRHRKYVLSARCRVDVTEQKPNEEVLGIDLTSPKVTADLYSTDYTQIDILPRLPQNEVAAFAATPEDNGAAITGAYLEDETARALFDLRVKDDRTLLVVPTQAAIEGAKGVKSSYSSKLAVSVNGVEYHTAEAVTIGVKKTLPKLKAGKLTFNPFYTGQSQALNITGGTVTKIEGTVPDWLELDGTKLTLKNAPKSGSASVNLLVYTEEWAVPVSVKVNVKLSYKAPAVKLSASSVSLSDSESKGTTLKLSAGKKTLEALGVESIRLPEGFEETVLDLSTGEFTLVPTGVIPTGKQTVRVYFYDTDAVLDLPLTVGKKSPVLKLSKSSVSLNGDLGDSVTLKVTATPVDLDLTKVVVTNPNEAVEVSPVNADGEFTVTVKAGTAPKANFPLTIQVPTGKAAKLTVKTLAAGQKVSMSLKAVGSIDLTYPEKGVDIQPIFKNYSGKLENIEYDLGDFLTLGEDDLLRWNGNIGLTTGTYPVTVTGNLPDGAVRSGTVKVKVIQTAVALKLGKTSLSLNKHLKESAQIAVTSGTKGYTLGTLGIRVTDSKNVPSDGLTAAYADGLLTLAVNDRTAYGSTYKVQLWATSNKISTVTVKIPAEKASAVTMTAKAKGQIDVIRDASQILVTPSYKNCMDGQALGKQVNVTWAKDGKNYTQDVTGHFDLNWADGALQVSRMPGETLELTGKYRLEILCEGMEKPAYVNLAVKSGTAKVTAAPVRLYTKDANHRAELTFMSSDRTLNAVARVELKDAKLKASYEVLDLGDDQFALRLRPGAKAKNGTVTVNLFFEGNNGKKPNATASVKVEIR